MLKAAPRPLSNQDKAPHILNFLDIDDTVLDLKDFLIKNPHFLLPIMLFQSRSAFHHMALLTNRPPIDNTVEFSVKQLHKLLLSFGIDIPEDQVIFCGSDIQHITDHQKLQEAIQTISIQLASLRVTQPSDAIAEKDSELKAVAAYIEAKKYGGKNYHINKFFDEHSHKESNTYQFTKGSCPKDKLTVVLVDDLATNTEAVSNLGLNFISVKATQGGKILDGEKESDFFNVNYLRQFARVIGFEDYALSVLNERQKHNGDDPLMQIAALLFCWQAYPELCKEKDFDFVEKLEDPTFLKIFLMMKYINEHANSHPDACFTKLTPLVNKFMKRADYLFLKNVVPQVKEIEIELQALNRKQNVSAPASAPERVKRGPTLKIFSRKSTSKTSVMVPEPAEKPASSENELRKIELANDKNIALACLHALTRSSDAELAGIARMKMAEIMQFVDVSSIPSPASTTVSSSSSDDVPALLGERRSYLPVASHRTPREVPRSASSAEVNDNNNEKADKKGKTKKNTGSNLGF